MEQLAVRANCPCMALACEFVLYDDWAQGTIYQPRDDCEWCCGTGDLTDEEYAEWRASGDAPQTEWSAGLSP